MTTQRIDDLALDIRQELYRLKADTSYNAYSGITASYEDGRVIAFDDYDKYELSNPLATLQALKALQPINWNDHDNTEGAFDPIWQAIQ